MATYTIIGSDQKQYGSVTADNIRNWIADGRLNAQSLMREESDTEFRPLSAFPEFSDLLVSHTPSPTTLLPSSAGGGREDALKAIKAPAIALIVAASIGIAYYLYNTVFIAVGGGPSFGNQPGNVPPQMRAFMEGFNRGAHGPMAIAISLVILAVNGFVLFGAIKMLRLKNFGVAMAAAIVAMVPCQCCCVLGLPFGIWALVTLNKPEVKSQFE